MSVFDAVLPAGIEWVRVGDLYEVTRKPRGLNLSSQDSIPFAPMDLIPQSGAFDASYEMRRRDQITSGTYFEKGDVLVAKITPSFENGKQSLAQNLPADSGYATTEVIPLRPRASGQDPRVLFFYLLHPDVRSAVAERMEGSTGRQRVPENALLDLQYPKLDRNEQSVVGDVLSLIQRSILGEAKSLENLAVLKRSAMRELFSRGLRGEARKDSAIGPVPESWNVATLGSLGRIGNGSTPKRTVAEYWSGGTFPWLNSGKIYDREIGQADQFVSERALADCHLPIVEPGSILIAITGQGKTLGHAAVLRMQATINQHLAYVARNLDKADPSYVRGYLETQYDYLRQVGGGGGSTKGALTCAFLRDMPIPLPALDEQREIAEILDAIDRKIDLHKRKRIVLEKLFNALLHKLMTGEIRVADLDLSALDAQVTAGAAA